MGIRNLLLTGSALILSGCAMYRAGAGFDSVQTETANRLRAGVSWTDEPELSSDLKKRVSDLLAEGLTVDDAVQIALLNNLELRALYEDLGLAQAELVSASLVSNPVFNTSRRFPGKAFEFDVAHNFLSLALLPLQKRLTEEQFEAAKLTLTHEIVNHAFETREAFYELQAALQTLTLQRTVSAALEGSAEAASRLRRAGNVPLLELQSEQALLAEAKLAVATGEQEVIRKRERLNVLMGLWGGETAWGILPQLREIPPEEELSAELEGVAVGTRADLLALHHDLAARGKALGLARVGSLLPELTLGGHFEREPEGGATTGPSISFALPVLDFGQAERGAARALFNQVRMRYAALAIKIRSEVRAAFGQMTIARARAKYYQDFLLPLHAKRLEQAQLQYNAMLIGVFDLIRLKQEQIAAGQQYVESLRDYWTGRTALERAIGRELPVSPSGTADGRPFNKPATGSHVVTHKP